MKEDKELNEFSLLLAEYKEAIKLRSEQVLEVLERVKEANESLKEGITN